MTWRQQYDIGSTRILREPGSCGTRKKCNRMDCFKEGYRFVPSGGASRFVSSELLAMDLSHIAFANSSCSTPGLLDHYFS